MMTETNGRLTLEVIVAAMNHEDTSLVEQMNIQSDALVCNQCSRDGVEVYAHNSNRVVYLNSTQRGVGRNRNCGIAHSTADILLFSDEDICYHDGYPEMIVQAYEKMPDADMIVFNLKRINDHRTESRDTIARRVRWYSSLRYGAARISIRRSALLKANVWFSLLFGGGSEFRFGEDCIFVSDCIKRGMKVYASDKEIGVVDQGNSSWFTGYDSQYYHDKGALFFALSKHLFPVLVAQYLIRHRNEFQGMRSHEVVKLMMMGRNKFLSYNELKR